MKQGDKATMFGRGVWLLLCACVLLWQVGQGIVTGIFGIPGVIEFPFGAIFGDSAANREGGVSVVRKTGQPEAHARVQAPESDEMGRWIRAEAREFVGGMDDDGNMLYRFDVWLVVPEEGKGTYRFGRLRVRCALCKATEAELARRKDGLSGQLWRPDMRHLDRGQGNVQ